VPEPELIAIPTSTHGRVLVRRAADPLGVLAGFHGYLESADIYSFIMFNMGLRPKAGTLP